MGWRGDAVLDSPIQRRNLRDGFINAVEEFRIYAERETRTDIPATSSVAKGERGTKEGVVAAKGRRRGCSEAMFVSAAAPLFPGRRGVSR